MKRIAILFAVAAPLALYAQGQQKPAAGGPKPEPGVNWEGQVIKATGAGAPDMKAQNAAQARLGAEKTAQLDAFRNLLAQVKGIQVSAGKTVGEVMSEKDEVKGHVEGLIRGYRVTAKRYFSDSGVEIDVEVPLAGISSAVNPPSPEQHGSLNTTGEMKNTGLVVDARGLKVAPALAPRILGADGKAVYSADSMSEEARKAKGVASYFKDLAAAQKSALVGEKPLVLKAARGEGSDLYLAADDLKKLTDSNNSYLAEGRVAIVTN